MAKLIETRTTDRANNYDSVLQQHGYNALDGMTYQHKSRGRGLITIHPIFNEWSEWYDPSHKLAGTIVMRGDSYLSLDQHLATRYNPFVGGDGKA